MDWRTYTSWVQFYYQRATRGWADCDVWGLDSYLNEWMPDALRRLAMTKQGIPSSVFEDKDFDEFGKCSDESMERASNKWNLILAKIIIGFEANKRMMNNEYESELGPVPGFDGDFLESLNDPMQQALRKERNELEKPLRERDEKLFQEGMVLFVEHYNSLWD